MIVSNWEQISFCSVFLLETVLKCQFMKNFLNVDLCQILKVAGVSFLGQMVSGGCLCRKIRVLSKYFILASVLFVLYREALVV